MIRLLLCLICVNMGHTMLAQHPPYFVLGSKDFANTDIYSLYYDEPASLLYTATDNGMFFYHGDAFVSIKADPKQKGNSLLDIQKGNDLIYCKNLRGQLFCVNEKNRLELVYELPSDQVGLYFWYYVTQDTLWIITNNSISSFPIYGKEIAINKETKYLQFFFKNGGSIDNCSPMSFGSRLSTPSAEEYIDIREGQVTIEVSPFKHQGRDYFEINNKLYSTNINGDLYDHKIGKVISNYQYNESFKVLNDNLVIGRCQTKGVHFLTPEGIINQPLSFKEKFISAVTQSSNGTIFLGTFNNGVLVIPNLDLKETSISGELLTSVAENQGRLFVSTRSGKVLEMTECETKLLYQSRENFDKLCFSPIKIGEIPNNPEILHSPSKSITNPKDIWKINDDSIILALYNRLTLLHNNNLHNFQNIVRVMLLLKILFADFGFNQ